ncbi:MmgE/PrpD family protein [Anaeroselena agilis]|uniref:MmgE/PrpD family protein n=1 Tax=Anaeroselena agilis TaxID=3063788 RepID=A0ABU3NZL5_9FIRM|nr:MmgE/PrpD family protein [Selenomonadales bacterium 4137-cl]
MATRELAAFTAGLRYDSLSPATRLMARQCILDWLACCIRGSAERPGQIIRRVVAAQGGREEATVFGAAPFRTTALQAALANGAFSHALDMDDLHNASIIHLGTVVVPAALAVAGQTGASGPALIAAIVAGYEVGARVGEAVNPEAYFYWHTTGTAGTFGAAAAAASLLGLDAEQTAHCLGSAGTQAAGLWEFLREGAMSKTLHAGKAAMNGILAAVLAREGFTGATAILEGEKGFCRAVSPVPRLEKLTAGLGGGAYKIDENSFKPYAACKHCHPAINAAQLLLRAPGFDIGRVRSIVVHTNSVAANLVDNPAPQNAYGSKFSLQYCIAAALRFGRVGVEEFAPGRAGDGELRRLMGCVAIEVDPALDAEYRRNPGKWSATVCVTMDDGERCQQFIAYPKGDPQNPVSYAETEDKFRFLAGGVCPEIVDDLLKTVAGLETLACVAGAFPG